jgi:ABC-2 type transport system ATP-binding protein
VIDRGRLSYDGSLERLVRRVRPEKRVVLHLERPVPAGELASLGRVIQHEPAEVVLQVAQAALHTTVARILAALPVADLTVENAPLEEVMGELFSRSRVASEETTR